ncbi:protein LYRIC-like isoform X3 [Takifugu flavidus]|uniref:protein LYRIC-like isoform X3 n=1 Tax=Takifugu flavidus TaxID=433684 RepID=UPI0025444F28|nr:protein LYRIC-like isoform X3 [Takifugu flavidus]
MMAGDFHGFTLEKAEQLFGRLREVLSSGQAYILTRFGVDLGLDPDLYPTWIVLSATAVVLLLLLALSWAAVRGAPLLGKTPASRADLRSCEPDEAGLAKPVRAEEQRKRNKKKPPEKTHQSNGQPGNVAPQRENPPGTVLKPKEDKTLVQIVQNPVQVKKNKKKARTDVKPVQHVSTNDLKEPDEGAWETKVSHREKKQQRRKDKGPEDSGSPGGTAAPKPHVVTALTKKNRGNSDSRGAGKGSTATRAVNSGGRTDASVKTAEQMGAARSSVHTAAQFSVSQKHQSWSQETQGAWAPLQHWPGGHQGALEQYKSKAGRDTGKRRGRTAWSSSEGQMKSGTSPAATSALGCDATEPPSNPAERRGSQYDEWSGFNRTSPADPSSDWYAPVEHWGNYEGVSVMAAPPVKQEPAPHVVSLKPASESEKREDPSDGAARAKKRRRRKKNPEEEGASDAQTAKLGAAPADIPAPASKKQNPSISSSQKGSQQSTQPPKPSQKKKAHREI